MDLGAPGLWGWGLLAGAAGFFPFNIGSEISWVTAFLFLKAALLNVSRIPLITKSWIFVRELHHHFPFVWSTGSKNMKKTDLVKYWKCSLGAWEWVTDSHFHHFYPRSQKSHPARLAAQPVPSGNFFLHTLLGTAAGQLTPPPQFLHPWWMAASHGGRATSPPPGRAGPQPWWWGRGSFYISKYLHLFTLPPSPTIQRESLLFVLSVPLRAIFDPLK